MEYKGALIITPALHFLLLALSDDAGEFRAIVFRTMAIGIPALMGVGAVLYLFWRSLAAESATESAVDASRRTKAILILLVVVLVVECVLLAQMDF